MGVEEEPQDETTGPLVVALGGDKFTVVDRPAQGALMVAMRRAQSKAIDVQAAAIVQLLERWIVPEEHERLLDVLERVEDLDGFMEDDLAKFIQAVTARPTQGRASSSTG